MLEELEQDEVVEEEIVEEEEVVTKESLADTARKKAEEKRIKRENELKKVKSDDGIIGLAGRLLDSNKAAKNAFGDAIKVIERHIEGVDQIQNSSKDDYIKAMYVFDSKLDDDYSSEKWDEEQEAHQENLDALNSLKEAMDEAGKTEE